MLPQGTAHETTDERLRVIASDLWERVKARQKLQSHGTGEKVKSGLRKRAAGGGRPPKYLLSGLLRCAACNASFVLSNGTRYSCATHHNGGESACAVSVSVPRGRVESIILECIEGDLLNPDRLAEIERRVSPR
jgi:hypothetical protein